MSKNWDAVKDMKEKEFLAEVGHMPDTEERKALQAKLKGVKKWPFSADKGASDAIKKLYEAAAKAKAEDGPQKISVALKSYTKPKFAHNATNAGTLPKWTFSYVDSATKKSGEVEISMTKTMTKDENTAKKMMADAAIAEIKKHYPKADVAMTSASLDK
jgi:hypothetical protein